MLVIRFTSRTEAPMYWGKQVIAGLGRKGYTLHGVAYDGCKNTGPFEAEVEVHRGTRYGLFSRAVDNYGWQTEIIGESFDKQQQE